MKIRLLSDLHLEGNYYTYEHLGEDVLVLAGDIHTRNRHHELLDVIPAHTPVIFVAGNHEYYHGNLNRVNAYLASLNQSFAGYSPNNSKLDNGYKNFHFLNNSKVIIDGVRFLGGTMWSDFNLYGPTAQVMAMSDAKRYISDFACVTIDDEKHYGVDRDFTPADVMHLHEEWEKWMKFELHNEDDADLKTVIVTHFCPHELSVHPRWKYSSITPYFTSNKEHLMGFADLWLHGHTHDSHDYEVAGTRVVCNPRGYGSENSVDFKPDLIINI